MSNIENWTAAELFDYLQTVGIISEDDDFEKWMHDRVDMIRMVNDDLDDRNS